MTGTFSILHLSDLHARIPGRLFWDQVDTNARLAALVDHLRGTGPRADLLLLTGDLVAEEEEWEAYRFVRAQVERLQLPYLIVPGNHDGRPQLREVFPEQPWCERADGRLSAAVDAGPLRLVLLDTVVEGEAYGELGESGAAFLETELRRAERPVVVVLHHPPMAFGLPFMDRLRLRDAERLAAALSVRPEKVQALLCGHLHRPAFARWCGLPLLVAPAVAFSCAPEMAEESSEALFLVEPPAVFLHRWHPQHGFASQLLIVQPRLGAIRRRR